MKRFGIITVLLACSMLAGAQDAFYAQLFNQKELNGTARVQAMGGAFGALGADISSASINPAGLAFYRRSEISFSSNMLFGNTKGKYLGSTQTSSLNELGMNQIGFVGSLYEGEGELKSFTFSAGYNQLADFDNKHNLKAYNSESSFTDYFAYLANGNTSDELADYKSNSMLADIAWNSYLIDPTDEENTYRSILDAGKGIQQTKRSATSGYSGEYFVSMAANYQHKLYIGATLGIRSMNYEEEWTVSEADIRNEMTTFDGFDYNARLRTNGTGMNLKFGFIYKPVYWIRAGLSVQTPTFFKLKHRLYHDITSSFKDGDNPSKVEVSTEFDYEMITPFQATASGALILKKQFIFSFDVDYLDYSGVRFSANDYDYDSFENEEIKNELTSTVNVRVGMEKKMGMFNFRLGGAYYGSPYQSSIDFDASKYMLSGGIGIRTNSFFADLALVEQWKKEKTIFFDKYDASSPTLQSTKTSAIFSFGFFF